MERVSPTVRFVAICGSDNWEDYRHFASPLFLANQLLTDPTPENVECSVLVSKLSQFLESESNPFVGQIPYYLSNKQQEPLYLDPKHVHEWDDLTDFYATIQELVKNLTEKDFLVLYLCGHGDISGAFYNRQIPIEPEDLNDEILKLSKATNIVIDSSCYSGIFCELLSELNNEVICLSSTTGNQKAYSLPKIERLNTSCGLIFSHAWLSAQLECLEKTTLQDLWNKIIETCNFIQNGKVFPCLLNSNRSNVLLGPNIVLSGIHHSNPSLLVELHNSIEELRNADLFLDDTDSNMRIWMEHLKQGQDNTLKLTILGDLLLREDILDSWKKSIVNRLQISSDDVDEIITREDISLSKAEMSLLRKLLKEIDPKLRCVGKHIFMKVSKLLAGLIKKDVNIDIILQIYEDAVINYVKHESILHELYKPLHQEWLKIKNEEIESHIKRAYLFFQDIISKCREFIAIQVQNPDLLRMLDVNIPVANIVPWIDIALQSIFNSPIFEMLWKFLTSLNISDLKRYQEIALNSIYFPAINKLCQLNKYVENFDPDWKILLSSFIPFQITSERGFQAVEDTISHDFPEEEICTTLTPAQVYELYNLPFHHSCNEENKFWKKNVFTVKFLSSQPIDIVNKVKEYASLWSVETDNAVQFVFEEGNSTADIRVDFVKGRTWAVVGTDANEIEGHLPTINFGFFNEKTLETQFRHSILHAFGHVLGLEHQLHNTNFPKWDKSRTVEYFQRMYNWPGEKTESNVINKFASDIKHGEDNESIMVYTMPAHLSAEPEKLATIPYNTTLSKMDKEIIHDAYKDIFSQ